MSSRVFSAIQAGLEMASSRVGQASVVAPAVSAWSVGQHLDHLRKVNDGILGQVRPECVGTTVEQGVSFIGRIVLWTGRIPRGRGRSPAPFMPEPVDAAALVEGFAAQQEVARRLAGLLPAIRAVRLRHPHPVFGGLTKYQWLVFLELHQRHHLAIIADIRKAAPPT